MRKKGSFVRWRGEEGSHMRDPTHRGHDGLRRRHFAVPPNHVAFRGKRTGVVVFAGGPFQDDFHSFCAQGRVGFEHQGHHACGAAGLLMLVPDSLPNS